MAKKPRLYKKIIAEFLFWLHTALIVAMTFMGLFLSIWWALGFLVIWRLHLWVFGGCVITLLQEKTGEFPKGQAYLKVAAKRFFGKNIGRKTVSTISWTLGLLSILIAIIATVQHIRL